jgi:hypothetical protein
MNRRDFLKSFSTIAIVGSSLLTAIFSFLRLINPVTARARERDTGVLLKDIKIDKYGRTRMKHKKRRKLNAEYDDKVQDGQRTYSSAPDEICDCPDLVCPCPEPPEPPSPEPDLICPCPEPPEPPWPVPDLVCPCPEPPEPPS